MFEVSGVSWVSSGLAIERAACALMIEPLAPSSREGRGVKRPWHIKNTSILTREVKRF